MLELWIAQLVTKAFQVGEPFQLADAQADPVRQRAYGFNGRELPPFRCRHGRIRCGSLQPFHDGEFLAMIGDARAESPRH